MIKKLKYLLFLIVCLFVYKNTYALNFSGNVNHYYALGDYNLQPNYDNNWGSSHNCTEDVTIDRNCYLPGHDSFNYYVFDKKMNFNLTSDTTLSPGNVYQITFEFVSEQYITFTNFYGWSLTTNRQIYNCKNGNNNMTRCSVEWSPTNNDSPGWWSSWIVVKFVPSVMTNNVNFDIGSTGVASDFAFWNRYGNQQAVNVIIRSSEVESTAGSTDMSETNEKLDDINDTLNDTNDKLDSIGDDLTDINDSITDDSSVSSNELEDFFDDIPLITSGPISDLLLLPTYILNAIINRSRDYCYGTFSIDLPYTDGGFQFTCWTLSDYLDSGTLNTITWILYVVMFYNIAMLVVSCWETWTNLSTDFGSMYSPRHAESEYKPKHGGGN